VESNISYNLLPVAVQVSYFPLTEASVLAYVTLQFENRDLQFQASDGVERATVNIFGRVTTMTRRTVMPFEATVTVDSPAQMLGEIATRRSVYNTVLPLAPGSYRLDIGAKDVTSGSVTHYQAALMVPRFDPEKLQVSSIVLADTMEQVAARSIGAGQFVVGDTKVRPRVDRRFRREERLGIYCKVYHPAGAQVEYEVVRSGRGDGVYSAAEELAGRPEATLERWVDLRGFEPGAYTVRVKVTGPNGETVRASAQFTVM